MRKILLFIGTILLTFVFVACANENFPQTSGNLSENSSSSSGVLPESSSSSKDDLPEDSGSSSDDLLEDSGSSDDENNEWGDIEFPRP